MRIIDISTEISEDMPVYPGDPATRIIPHFRIAVGDEANVSCLQIGTHTGTHVDPPLHFFDGLSGIDEIALDRLAGRAFVLDMTHIEGAITEPDLKERLEPYPMLHIVLLKTRKPESDADAYLTENAASFIVRSGIKSIGIDHLSIEHGDEDYPVHRRLLSNNVTIIEGLDLSGVAQGSYFLLCLPLKIKGGDGGPARAVLIDGVL